MTKKPIIAVDIDDVLADSAASFVGYSNQKWGTNLHVDDYSEHWAEMWQLDMNETKKRAEHIYESQIQSRFPVIESAKPVLQQLAQDYDLLIVTSRHRLVQEDTVRWIDEHYKGIFKEIKFAGIWDKGLHFNDAVKLTKGEIIHQLGVDYLIDDQPKHCFAAAKKGITGLVFGNYSWNREIESDKHIVRARTWEEVAEYFKNEAKKRV